MRHAMVVILIGMLPLVGGGESADISGDGVINLEDLALLTGQWLTESAGLTSYDNSPVELMAGGYGFVPALGGAGIGVGFCLADVAHPIRTAGTLKTVRARLYAAAGESIALAKLKIIRGSASPYTLVHDIDITDEVNASFPLAVAARLSLTLDLSAQEYPVQDGDMLCWFFDTLVQPVSVACAGGAIAKGLPAHGDQTGTSVILAASLPDLAYLCDATVSVNSFLPLIDTTGWGDGDQVNIPGYLDLPYYIVLEDVKVPDGTLLSMALHRNNPDDGADNQEKALQISFDNRAHDSHISIDGFVSFKNIPAEQYSPPSSNIFNIYFWVDPVNDKLEVLYCNETGQGPKGFYDWQRISLTDRNPISITDAPLRRLVFTDVAAGTATVAKVVVCRKPFVVAPDSFVAAFVPWGAFSRVAAALNGLTSEPRYFIQAGLSSNRLTPLASHNLTDFLTRWNSPSTDQDIVAYRDVVYVFCANGDNDAGSITSYAEAFERAAELAGGWAQVVSQAIKDTDPFGGRNDVVLIGPIGIPTGHAYFTDYYYAYYERLNQALRAIAYAAHVPYVDKFHLFWGNDSLFASSFDIHPGGTATNPEPGSGAWILAQAAITLYQSQQPAPQ